MDAASISSVYSTITSPPLRLSHLATFSQHSHVSPIFLCLLLVCRICSMHSSRPDPLLGAVKAHRSNPAKTCKNHRCTKCRLPMRHFLSSHNPCTPVRHVSGSPYSSARRRLNVQSGQRKGRKVAAASSPSVAIRDRGH